MVNTERLFNTITHWLSKPHAFTDFIFLKCLFDSGFSGILNIIQIKDTK